MCVSTIAVAISSTVVPEPGTEPEILTESVASMTAIPWYLCRLGSLLRRHNEHFGQFCIGTGQFCIGTGVPWLQLPYGWRVDNGACS